MKYAYATMIVLCLLASTSWSASNPLIRNCNLAGGEFTVVEIKSQNDQWALCNFDEAYVGALDVMLFNTHEAYPISFNEYTANKLLCTGQVLEAQIVGTERTLLLCRYKDQSLVDLNTLYLGPYNPGHLKLNNFLGL